MPTSSEGETLSDASNANSLEEDIDDKDADLSNENAIESGNISYEEALQMKERGNEAISQGDYQASRDFYLKSMRIAKRLPESERDSLLKVLYLNLAQSYLNLSLWSKVVNSATSALRYDASNVKALYRRGYAYRMTKQWKEAKDDLMRVLSIDPLNSRAKQELALLRKNMQQEKEDFRKGFHGFYGKNLGLYDDREKKVAVERQKEEERLREDWTKQMDLRREKGEEEISFDEWKETRSVESTTESSKKDENAQEPPKLPDPTPLRPKSSVSEIQVDDEEEQKIIEETKRMGYCYFRRELTSDEKRLNALNVPQRLPSSNAAAPQTFAPSPASLSINSSGPTVMSDWNAGGTTYEERDVTQWAHERFTEKLMAVKAHLLPEDFLKHPSQLASLLDSCSAQMDMATGKNGNLLGDSSNTLLQLTTKFSKLSLEVKKITGLSGEAHMSVVRGKQRFFFEFSCGVEFTIELDPKYLLNIPDDKNTSNQDSIYYSGELKLMDCSNLSSNSPDWLKDSSIRFNETLLEQHRPSIDKLIELFKQEVRSSIEAFLKECQ